MEFTNVAEVAKQLVNHPGFARWWTPLEQQIINIAEGGQERLYALQDVSGGHGQAFTLIHLLITRTKTNEPTTH